MLLCRSCSACRPLSNLHSLKRHSAAHLLSSRLLTGSSVEFTTRHEILTLLHKTTSLLPRVLESKSDNRYPSYPTSLEFWADILSGAYEDVTSTADRPARIAGSSQFPITEEYLPRKQDPSLIQQKVVRPPKESCFKSVSISFPLTY